MTSTEILTPSVVIIDPRVVDHFHASAELYKLWSREGHLHFGYWQWPIAPWDRNAMLEALTQRVVGELRPNETHELADLGCGYGSSARLVARTYGCAVQAFTVVSEQVMEGRTKAEQEDLPVTMHLRDFRDTGVASGTMDGVYAMESLCYGSGQGKADVLSEAARILRPGGRIALVDGFIVKPPTGIRKRVVRTVEDGWAVPCFPRQQAFVRAMERAGFMDIRITDLSYRVAPSALHGLPLMAWTKLRNLFKGKRLDPLENAHLKSCLYGIAMGTQRDLFRYLLITAQKR